MINENQMRTFVEAAKCHNFTTAARNLYVTQPTVTKSIAKLEKALNTELFHRLPDKRLIITEKGEQYYQLFQSFLSELDGLIKNQPINSENIKKIRLAYMSGWSLAESKLNIITNLKIKYPQTTFELFCLDNQEIIDSLITDDLENTIDIAISLEEPLQEIKGVHHKVVTGVDCVVIYSGDFEKDYGRIDKLSDLADAPFLIPKGDMPYLSQSKVLKKCITQDFYPKFRTVRNFETVLAMVNSSLGVAIFDTWDQRFKKHDFKHIDLGIKQNIAIAWRQTVPKDMAETLIQLLSTHTEATEH